MVEITSNKAAYMVEQISIDLSAPIAIIELLAERDSTSVSAVLWSLKDVLEEQQQKLDELTERLMYTYRKQMGIEGTRNTCVCSLLTSRVNSTGSPGPWRRLRSIRPM